MHRFIYINGIRTTIYPYFGFGATLVLFLFNYLYFKQKKESLSRLSLLFTEKPSENRFFRFFKSPGFFAFIEIFLVSFQYNLANSFATPFGKIIGDNINYFGMLFAVPFFLLLFYYEVGLNPLKQTDTIAPSFPLALIVAKLGCFFAGCCHGYEWEHGIYNMKTERLEFPVQLVEMTVALLIFAFLMYYKKKAKPGTLFPLFTILYSATRFFSEFLRGEAEPLFWLIKPYHLFCVAGVILGIIEYIIAVKYGNKLVELCENSVICNFIEKRIMLRRKKKLDKKKPIVHHKKKKVTKKRITTRHK